LKSRSITKFLFFFDIFLLSTLIFHLISSSMIFSCDYSVTASKHLFFRDISRSSTFVTFIDFLQLKFAVHTLKFSIYLEIRDHELKNSNQDHSFRRIILKSAFSSCFSAKRLINAHVETASIRIQNLRASLKTAFAQTHLMHRQNLNISYQLYWHLRDCFCFTSSNSSFIFFFCLSSRSTTRFFVFFTTIDSWPDFFSMIFSTIHSSSWSISKFL
jgi:hypothetical protein